MSKRGLFSCRLARASALGCALFVSSALFTRVPLARGDDAASAALPAPPLSLTVSPGTSGGPWRLKIENTGDVPVRLAADPRLLVLVITPPAGFVDEAALKAKKKYPVGYHEARSNLEAVRCTLPDDARPATDEGRELVVPSKRSWSTTIDPLLYCFSAHDRARLVTGATVEAHLGWPPPPVKPGARTSGPAKKPLVIGPPFVATPVGAAVGRIAPAKELVAGTFALAESVAGSGPGPGAGSGSGPLSVSLPDALDVGRGVEVSTTVTVANDGAAAIALLLRPETLRFSVAGPAGSVACGTTRDIGSPIRELFSTLGAKGRGSVSVLLTAMCPSGTFDEPGIYRVTPILDTSGASGRSIGLRTWDGVVEGRTPMLLRVRSVRRATAPVTRPALD